VLIHMEDRGLEPYLTWITSMNCIKTDVRRNIQAASVRSRVSNQVLPIHPTGETNQLNRESHEVLDNIDFWVIPSMTYILLCRLPNLNR
jgi:hypothetical protein